MTTPGIIYALSEGQLPNPCPTGDHFQIKIGLTTGASADSRLNACQTGNPRELKIVAEYSGYPKDETRLHKLLSSYRQSGEWFCLPGVLANEFNDSSLSTALGLWRRFRELGVCGPGMGPELQNEAQKRLYAFEAIKRAQHQTELAESLVFELECLDDTGALTEEMLLDAMASAGISLVVGDESLTHLVSVIRSEAVAA